MLAYFLRRVLATIPVVLMVALFVFSLLYIAPGDPAAIIAGVREEALALGGQLDFLLLLADQPLLSHAVEHLHAEIAGQMVVANPRAAQGRFLWPGAQAHV